MSKIKLYSDLIDIKKRKEIVDSGSPQEHQWLGYDYYFTDGKNVICIERGIDIIENADPYSFHLFPKVKIKITQRNINYDINQIVETEAKETLHSFAIDCERVYYNQNLLKEIDSQSFCRIGSQGYAYDSKHLLFTDKIIALKPSGKIKTYGLLLKTENSIYVAGRIVNNIDINSFECLNNKKGVFKDKNTQYQLYCNWISRDMSKEFAKLVKI
ncbi:DKNYY domain-containing protein [Polaribacter uvawellassae]|uniref:DKNYY domain-containing protein n=1 Tax=Polaribacter uvawellassae TaxID=3133495 RepID=UPI00321BED3C